MPPHRHHPHPKPHIAPHRGIPHPRGSMAASKVLGFVDEKRLDQLLAPLVPDAADRTFIVRCVVGEGPIHHRGANYILLTLLAQLLERQPMDTVPRPGVGVPMRLPPHLVDDVEEGVYPLTLPTTALLDLAGGDAGKLDAMVDCLTDGPPQHALANVVMVSLLESLLATPRS